MSHMVLQKPLLNSLISFLSHSQPLLNVSCQFHNVICKRRNTFFSSRMQQTRCPIYYNLRGTPSCSALGFFFFGKRKKNCQKLRHDNKHAHEIMKICIHAVSSKQVKKWPKVNSWSHTLNAITRIYLVKKVLNSTCSRQKLYNIFDYHEL